MLGTAFSVLLLAASPALAAPLTLNEYNGVAPDRLLDNEGSDPYFGRVLGNGGDWLELVVVADHLDIRGWRVIVVDDGGTSLATLVFANLPLWADLRAGTIITIAEEVADDPSYDPANGDWWINARAGTEGGGSLVTAIDFSVSNNDTLVSIRTVDDLPVFGPAGESIVGEGVNGAEVLKLEEDPSALITPTSGYNDGTSSTFGAPNVFGGGTMMQDFSPLRAGEATEDQDFDGVRDCEDLCPEARNPEQRDTDGDGFGDVCDADQGGEPGPGRPPEGCTGIDIYDPTRLVEVEIRMTQANWDALRKQGRKLLETFGGDCTSGPPASPFEWFSADVTIEGVSLANVGVRKKGFLGSLDTVRPSLKLDTDRFVDGLRLFGIENFTFNNSKQDPSRIKTCLGYQLFAAAGAPASRCTFAHVRVVTEGGTQDLGIYANVEDIEDPFLERVFGNSSGNLYEGSFGADFRPRSLPIFEKENNEDTNDGSDVRALAEVLGQSSDEQLLDALAPLIDIEAFYTYWATEGLIGHWDGYAGDLNNYFVYHSTADDRFHFIPWGVDDILGQGSPLRNEGPVSPLFWARGKLPYRLYLHPLGATRYQQKLQALLDSVWNETAILAEIDRMQTLIAPVTGDLSVFIDPIRTFVSSRRAKFAADFAEGPPAWDEPLPEQFCLEQVGDLRLAFDTLWSATIPMVPPSLGIESLTGSLYGIDLSTLSGLRFAAAGGSDSPQFAGRGLLRLVFQFVDQQLYVIQVNFPPQDVAPSVVLPIDSDLANAFVAVDASQQPSLLGSLAEGELRFDDEKASTTPSQPFAGVLESKITQFAPAPGSCAGDCDRDQRITAADLVGAAASTAGGEAYVCPEVDRSENFGVEGMEVDEAIRRVFTDCPRLQAIIIAAP